MGEMTFFILEFIDLIINGQKKAILDLEEVKSKWDVARNYLKNLRIKIRETDAKKLLTTIIESYLFSPPEIDYSLAFSEIIEEVNLSEYLTRKILTELEKEKLIKKDKKGKAYKYKLTDKVIEIINEI